MLHTEKLYCSLLCDAGSEISPEDQAQVAMFAEALDAGDSQARAYSRKVWQMYQACCSDFRLHACGCSW